VEAIDFSIFIDAIRTMHSQARQMPRYFLPNLFGSIAGSGKSTAAGRPTWESGAILALAPGSSTPEFDTFRPNFLNFRTKRLS